MRRLLIVLAAGIALAGCGSKSGTNFEIGLKRVAVDLAFKDESKLPEQPSTQVAFTPQPVQSVAQFITQVPQEEVPVKRNTPPVVAPKVGPQCPTADENSVPELPATVLITKEPEGGIFHKHVTGTFSVTTAFTFQGNFPPFAQEEIKNVRQSEVTDPVNGAQTVWTYDVLEHGIDGSLTTTSYKNVLTPSGTVGYAQDQAGTAPETQGEVDLTKIVTINAQGTSTFEPSPAITMMVLQTGQGNSWNSAGIDQKTGTSMVVQGSIDKREVVDLCGTKYDTWRVISNEKVTNLQTGLSSQTDANDPNVYNVATTYGGLFVRRHIHTSCTCPTTAGAEIVNLNYTSTYDSIHPAQR